MSFEKTGGYQLTSETALCGTADFRSIVLSAYSPFFLSHFLRMLSPLCLSSNGVKFLLKYCYDGNTGRPEKLMWLFLRS